MPENNGCPTNNQVVTEVSRSLEGIEFDLNSDRILSSNTAILNSAVNYINSSEMGSKYTVVGAADARGTVQYNQKLSQKRANNVKNYLIQNGVQSSRLDAVGHGKSDLKYPECNPASKCPEWKTELTEEFISNRNNHS